LVWVLNFGYGEDNDFGMKLRNQGHDVSYLPKPQILHLKAPMGGSEPNHLAGTEIFYSAQTITNSHVVSIVTQTKEQQRIKTTLF
jgi:GT2 family glycosyltransferase